VLKYDLPFTTVSLCYKGLLLEISDVLVDTGSGCTIFSVDVLSAVNIIAEPQDTLYLIRGIGGYETVFTKRVDYLKIGNKSVHNFEVEVGSMDYGFTINGILGMDFLTTAGVILDLKNMQIMLFSFPRVTSMRHKQYCKKYDRLLGKNFS
jgi:hypothetical protein